jgi:hypothetical protein
MKEKLKEKENNMNLENQIVKLLNSKGYEDLRTSTDKSDGSVTVRNGYWEHINPEVISKVEDTFGLVAREFEDWDEDCGTLYWYDLSVREYTDEELMELEYLEELEFLHRYETGEWGVA